jgi:hypothetical protein
VEEVTIVANRHVSQLVLKFIVVHHQLLCLAASESARLLIYEIITLHSADVRALRQLQSLLQNVHHLLLFRRGVYRQDRVELAVLRDRQRGTVRELRKLCAHSRRCPCAILIIMLNYIDFTSLLSTGS